MSLALVLLADRRLEGMLLRGRPLSALHLIAFHRSQNACGLLSTHDRDSRVGPLEKEPWRVGSPTHGVVSRAVATADDDGEFRHAGTRHGRHKFGTILRDAAGFRPLPDHEAR